MRFERRKIFLRDIMKDKKMDAKQFKRITGSPILYTKLRKHRALYYPATKYHIIKEQKPSHSHHHACIVYSKTYGREVYSNIDIWPDETARERLIEKLKGLSFSQEDDVGIDSPTEVESYADEIGESAEDTLLTKPSDERRHVTIVVTDTAGDDTSTSSGKVSHLIPDRTGSPVEGEGTWPLKRSQSIDSRDNPFLPGGSLRQEADDILSKATIIRDRFILKDDNIKLKNHEVIKETPRAGKAVSSTDVTSSREKTKEYLSDSESNLPINENMTQEDVQKIQTSFVQNATPPRTRTKENGTVDTENSLSPGNVTVEIADDNKDKKKQKKCCAVM